MNKLFTAAIALAALALTAVGDVFKTLVFGPPMPDRLFWAVTHDATSMAIKYRMGAGYAGRVNRLHPASIEPCKIYATSPPTGYGKAVLIQGSDNSVRDVAAGDTAVVQIYGIAVQPFPYQQDSGGMSASIGVATPPTSGVMDVLRDGYIMSYVNGTPVKGGNVFVWVAASSGAHVQGMFEAAATGGSTAAILNAVFNGPPDANGITEIQVWKRTS